jgi:hypothetical protein
MRREEKTIGWVLKEGIIQEYMVARAPKDNVKGGAFIHECNKHDGCMYLMHVETLYVWYTFKRTDFPPG